MPPTRRRSRKGQGRQGNGEGRDGTGDFPAPWVVSLLPALLSALSLLPQAKESIEQLIYLCQTDKEPVREAAKQSLMLCGECPTTPLRSLPTHRIPSGISRCRQRPREKGVPGWSLPNPAHSGSSCPKLCRARASGQRATRARHAVATER